MNSSAREYRKVTNPGGWVSASPLPDAETLREFYADLYYQQPQTSTYQAAYDDTELAYRDLKCRTLLRALAAHGLTPGGAFLDVGAGEGFLLDAADREGYVVTGADFSAFGLSKFFPRLQPRLLVGDVMTTLDRLAAEGATFAACSAINVLEHVIDPAGLLDSLARVVAPRGTVAITVPNDFSRLQAHLIGEGHIDREFWFVPPQHLHYFNAENLPVFCEARGYRMVDAFSDFPIDTFLLHPGSNYIANPAAGRAAHQARLRHDLLLAEAGLDAYLDYYRALFRVGAGRDITVLLQRAGA